MDSLKLTRSHCLPVSALFQSQCYFLFFPSKTKYNIFRLKNPTEINKIKYLQARELFTIHDQKLTLNVDTI